MFTTRVNRRAIIGLGTTMAAAAGGARIVDAQTFVTPEALELKDSYTFLVMGLDTRPDGQGLSTDVLMVSRVDLNENTVRTMSIPRDLYAEIPGIGFDKINSAFASVASNGHDEWMSGMAATRNTIEYNFGLTIDAALSVRFEGVEAIVDTLGGVTVENPYDLYDDSFPTMDYGTKEIFYPAGTITLSGEEALEFMRTRHQDGDDGRIMRQHLVLTSLYELVTSPDNVARLPELVTTGLESVTTTIPQNVQMQLIAAAPKFSLDDIHWGTMTHLLWGDTLDSGMWVYQGDWDQLPGYVQAFLNGEI